MCSERTHPKLKQDLKTRQTMQPPRDTERSRAGSQIIDLEGAPRSMAELQKKLANISKHEENQHHNKG